MLTVSDTKKKKKMLQLVLIRCGDNTVSLPGIGNLLRHNKFTYCLV